jgi:hypothetical protein
LGVNPPDENIDPQKGEKTYESAGFSKFRRISRRILKIRRITYTDPGVAPPTRRPIVIRCVPHEGK